MGHKRYDLFLNRCGTVEKGDEMRTGDLGRKYDTDFPRGVVRLRRCRGRILGPSEG